MPTLNPRGVGAGGSFKNAKEKHKDGKSENTEEKCKDEQVSMYIHTCIQHIAVKLTSFYSTTCMSHAVLVRFVLVPVVPRDVCVHCLLSLVFYIIIVHVASVT